MARAGFSTRAAADDFLARYLAADGRVVRHDQGGDVVSEGQAYAMLIAEIAGKPAAVRTIWLWTKAHLARADGLLAFHAAADGTVISHQPATDADVLAAYALLRYDGLHDRAMHADGRRLAAAVLAEESIPAPSGDRVLVAGRWAAATSPPTVNPSYWMPGVFTALAGYTDDERWEGVAATSEGLLLELTGGGRSLPPDWASLTDDGTLTPRPAPDGGHGVRHGVQYGLDAARLPLWLGTGCSEPGRALAAAWWDRHLSGDGRSAALALSLTGEVLDGRSNPLPLLAGAAAAAAAGDLTASRRLRSDAVAQGRETPTYYGDAWLALGGALLDGALCPGREARGRYRTSFT
jgi:endo-1,4-beta-D-glucanase Y